MKSFLYLLLSVLCFPALAQKGNGHVEVIQDKRVDVLVSKQKQLSENIRTIPGYRVQIFFESGSKSSQKAMQVKEQFAARFPGQEAYVIFQEPYYKVRVGNFRTKMEAQGFKQKIILDYPGAFVVKDDIMLPQ